MTPGRLFLASVATVDPLTVVVGASTTPIPVLAYVTPPPLTIGDTVAVTYLEDQLCLFGVKP